MDATASGNPGVAGATAAGRAPAGDGADGAEPLEHCHPTAADPIRAVFVTLEQELKDTRDNICRHVGGHPSLKHRRDLLESIPGVGAATAAWLLTVLSEHDGFTDAQQAVAPVGLAPTIRQSGPWAGKTRLSKTGDPRVRKALYRPTYPPWYLTPPSAPFASA